MWPGTFLNSEPAAMVFCDHGHRASHKASASKPGWLCVLIVTIPGPLSLLKCAWELFGSMSAWPVPTLKSLTSLLTDSTGGSPCHSWIFLISEQHFCGRAGAPIEGGVAWDFLLIPSCRDSHHSPTSPGTCGACVSACKPGFSLQPSPPSFTPPPFLTGLSRVNQSWEILPGWEIEGSRRLARNHPGTGIIIIIIIILPFMLQIHCIVSILLYKPFHEPFIMLINEPFAQGKSWRTESWEGRSVFLHYVVTLGSYKPAGATAMCLPACQ